SIIVNMELTDMPYTFSEGEIDDQIASLIKQKTILEMQRLYDQIKVAQQKNDSQLIIQLTQKIIELKRKII
ncbi:MAG: DNA primase, partial [Lactobacillus iners]|nr:DNA primase [Lactobacillus iners]